MEVAPMSIDFIWDERNLPRNRGFKNTVFIEIHTLLEAYIQDDNGVPTRSGLYLSPPPPSSHFTLQPRNFTPRHVTQLLDHLVPDLSLRLYLTEIIVDIAEFTRPSSQRPLFISLALKITRKILYLVPTPSMAASRDVFQRLEEEQRVESCDFAEEEACSICIEKLSESETNDHESIIQLPGCLHMFHQDCIFEWLRLQNSCPLCRHVPYDEDHQEIE